MASFRKTKKSSADSLRQVIQPLFQEAAHPFDDAQVEVVIEKLNILLIEAREELTKLRSTHPGSDIDSFLTLVDWMRMQLQCRPADPRLQLKIVMAALRRRQRMFARQRKSRLPLSRRARIAQSPN